MLVEIISVVVAVLGFGAACFSIGYTLGKDKDSNIEKTRK
jgi:hypothetical protein